jgi:hypothetical protein
VQHSYGVDLQVDEPGPGFVSLGEVVSLGGMAGWEVGAKERPYLTTPNALIRKIPGLAKGKDLDVKLEFKKSTWALLNGMRREVKNWKIVVPGAEGGTQAFSGFLTSLDTEIPEDDGMVISMTIAVDTITAWVDA